MDKRESTELKAFAIILMFWHHLFGCGTGLSGGHNFKWHSILTYSGDVKLGLGCKLCIALFAFSSGYGLYKSYISNGRYKRILGSIIKFLIQYWVILFGVAIPYLCYFNNFDSKYFLINLFAWIRDDEILYVSLSWYVKVHLLFLCASPILKYLSGKVKALVGEILLYIILPILISSVLPNYETGYDNYIVGIISTFWLFCSWLPIFYVGVIFGKYKIIEIYRSKCNDKYNVWYSIVSFFSMIGVIFIRAIMPSIITDIFCVVIFVFCFDYIYVHLIKENAYIDNLLYFVGDYSFQFWLLSGMFYFNTTEFFNILYWPKWSPFILIWNFIILTPLAIITKKISVYMYANISKFILKLV